MPSFGRHAHTHPPDGLHCGPPYSALQRIFRQLRRKSLSRLLLLRCKEPCNPFSPRRRGLLRLRNESATLPEVPRRDRSPGPPGLGQSRGPPRRARAAAAEAGHPPADRLRRLGRYLLRDNRAGEDVERVRLRLERTGSGPSDERLHPRVELREMLVALRERIVQRLRHGSVLTGDLFVIDLTRTGERRGV